MNTPADKNALVAALAQGNAFSFLFFWGHRQKLPGIVDRSCLSQWFPARFSVSGVSYPTAEHYMMAEKARIFGDQETRELILVATDPGAAKKLGRTVRDCRYSAWEGERMAVAINGNLAKFSQNPHLRTYLLSTGDDIIVEASPSDRIWGIGLEQSHQDAARPRSWPGLNLLGFALMHVRGALVRGPPNPSLQRTTPGRFHNMHLWRPGASTPLVYMRRTGVAAELKRR
jgi:ribA/ribD-fused uncharacterized protein